MKNSPTQIVSFFTVLLALFLLPRSIYAQNVEVENEFVKIVVNNGEKEIGRFSVSTTGGDPANAASKNQQLIYGGADPWTSFTTINVNGKLYVFGGKTERRPGRHAEYGEVISKPKLVDGVISTTCKYGDLLVTQELSLVRGDVSLLFDTVNINYRLENSGRTPITAGIRILLDTKLGPNDGAPIRSGTAAGAKSFTAAVSLQGDDIPKFWQAVDKLPDYTIASRGGLKDTGLTIPDRVIFADWGSLADNLWVPKLFPQLGFHRKWEDETEPPANEEDMDELDTASALYWEPIAIAPGKSISYNTSYGMDYLKSTRGELSITVSGVPKEVIYEYERTKSFQIMGYVTNTSTGAIDAREVKFALKLPEGLELVSGSKPLLSANLLKPGDELQASWVIRPNGKQRDNQKIEVTASSANLKPNSASETVLIHVPRPQLLFLPDDLSVSLKTMNRPTLIPVRINLKPAVDFYGAKFVVVYDPKVVKPLLITRGNELVEEGRFLGDWFYDDSEEGRIIISCDRGDAALLTQAEINLTTITFRTVAAGKTSITLQDAKLIDQQHAATPVTISAGTIEVK